MRLTSVAVSVIALLPCLGAPASDRGELFSSYSPIGVSLKAPFDDLFAGAQMDAEYSVSGTLSYKDASTGKDVTIDDVEISVRGRTSKRETECSFPKLKLRFSGAESVKGSIFSGMKAVKIGTHCGDQADGDLTARFGRWANEKAPVREAFIYRLLDVLGVRSFKARPARITYLPEDSGPLVRGAMFLEDDREAMKRFNADEEVEPPRFRDAEQDFSPEDTAKLAFAEALIGNFDWCLKFFADDTYRCDARRPLWNVMAFAAKGGRAFPVMYDFDIAGMVVGRHRWFPEIFFDRFEGKSAPAVEVLAQVQHTRAVFPRAVLDATRRAFIDRKEAAFAALRDATLDDEGRRIAEAYLNGFFTAIASDEQFYAPVVLRSGERIYLDAARAKPACPRDSVAPPGTLVGRPVGSDGTMINAPILDVRWKWTAPAPTCDAIHRGPVWIDRAAVGTEYPARNR
jgi:hypothetical protein